jgi:hypothetical protein
MRSLPIKDYEHYLVYEDGKIYNTKRKRFLVNVLSERYQVVLLYKNGKRKMFYVHRLVAQTFCIKKAGADHVNHIDSNKLNNHYTNLEWVTCKENVLHYINSSVYKKRKLNEMQIQKIKENNYKKVKCLLTNKIFFCITDFANYKKISLTQASMKLNNKNKNNLMAELV